MSPLSSLWLILYYLHLPLLRRPPAYPSWPLQTGLLPWQPLISEMHEEHRELVRKTQRCLGTVVDASDCRRTATEQELWEALIAAELHAGALASVF